MCLIATSKCLLNTSGDSDSTLSLWSLLQWFKILLGKKFLLLCNLSLPWSNVKPFPFVLLLILGRRHRPPSQELPQWTRPENWCLLKLTGYFWPIWPSDHLAMWPPSYAPLREEARTEDDGQEDKCRQKELKLMLMLKSVEVWPAPM